MRASDKETSLHPQWLGHYLSAALQAISQHPISGALQRHRMTDAGMRLDRAGGGAASGEVERLPGRFSLFSFFYKRKREVTSIQKAAADNQPHGRKRRGCEEREKQIKDMTQRLQAEESPPPPRARHQSPVRVFTRYAAPKRTYNPPALFSNFCTCRVISSKCKMKNNG